MNSDLWRVAGKRPRPVGKYLGTGLYKGGLGSAYLSRHRVSVGAIAVVNSIGDVLD